jgi:hypothetical protein
MSHYVTAADRAERPETSLRGLCPAPSIASLADDIEEGS